MDWRSDKTWVSKKWNFWWCVTLEIRNLPLPLGVPYSRNMSANIHNELHEKLGFKEIKIHQHYLGLPTFIGRSKRAVFRMSVIESGRNWKGGRRDCFLEWVGRCSLKQLFRHTHLCDAVFWFPKSLYNDFERLFRRFWWTHNVDNSCLVWVAWDQLYNSKREGLLDFHEFHCFNLALLGKQCWRR